MGQMIIEFICYEFDKKYDYQCSNICAGNTLLPEGQKSMYWMFENKSHAKTKGDWTTNSQLDLKEIGAMNHMEKVLFDALNTYNKTNNMKERTYKYYLSGIVKTGDAQNQALHLDSMNPDYEDPYSELIVHIPKEQEVQWLRTGKEVLNEDGEVENLIHKMIHIPFGSYVLLPMTQLHAGHYGVFANT